MGKHFPTAVVGIHGFGIDCHHNGLRTKKAAGLVHQIRIGHRCRVDAGLVCTCIEQTAHIGHRTHTTAHGQGNEHLAGHAFNHMQNGVAVVRAGSNVQEGDFVRTLIVVTLGHFNRVARVAQRQEIHAFDHAAIVNVQTRDNAFC